MLIDETSGNPTEVGQRVQIIRKPQQETSAILRRLKAGLIPGIVGIAANMLLLWSAGKMGIATSHGGLLRLTEILLERMIHPISSVSRASHATILPVSIPWFQNASHILTGLMMSAFYAFFLEVRLPAGAWKQGIIYGGAVWLFNSFIVLPITGEGLFGIHHLRLTGILSFGIAHMTFFLVLCFGFRKLCTPSSMT